MSLPRVRIPQRDYFLLTGPLSAVVDETLTAGVTKEGHPGIDFVYQPPAIFWPEDRSWCVASEIDLNSTYVAGSAELIADLMEEPALETWPVARNGRIELAADEINAE